MASNTAQGDVDEFDDDDLDLEELLEVVQTVEQQHAATTTTAEDRTISFVSSEDDPTPPPPLPPSTACHHKFDPENLRTWIYPVNYPLRGYQLNIVKKALFHNTLVALPTGLGKTFIAAVVMYNYYRWFPESIIIFMAPTRPLVEQQIEACHKICGLQETTLLMGTTSAAKRTLLWRDNRVFFATPQTVEKDIASRQFPLEKVACVVVDEAHRATGNFAYSVVIRKLAQRNKHFRVLALTATPGSTLDAVQDVITNLQITNIQIRTEDSMDIREFSHGKNIQNITVRLDYTEGSTGLLPRIINDYRNKVFQPLLDDLARKPSGVQPDIDQVTPYGLMSKRNYFMATAKNLNASLKFSIFQSFLMAEAVCRAYDRLCHHGIGSFVDTVQNKLEEFKKTEESGKKLKKAEIAFKNNHHLQNILTMAKRAMENPDFAGHPKIDRMVSILIHHFTSLAQGEASKVMVFSTYRSSVTEICKVLDRHRPIIRCSPFVGQSMDKKGAKGLNQREQQEVIQKFKKDEINVIVATSIGEEGLDIGEVDLIICYDSESSPIRMLQRMGRTGRKRQGKCILLLTQSEEKKYARAKEAYAKIQQLIARGCNLNYYKPNPPVLPANYKPTICRKVLTVRPYVSSTSVNKRKRNNQQTKYTAEGYLQPAAQRTFIESFSDSQGQRFTNIEEIKDRYWPAYNTKRSLSKYLPLQAQAKSTFRVDHSHRTIRFTGLINRIEQRILNPDKRIRLNVSSTGNDDRPGDNILVLPSKSKPSISIVTRKSSKATVKTEQRRLHDWQNEADMAEFMEQQNIRQIVGIDNESSFENSFSLSLPFNEIEQPRKESKILLSPVRNMPTKVTKGKEKVTELSSEITINNKGGKDGFDLDFDKNDFHSSESSWEPMLPDSLFMDDTLTGPQLKKNQSGNDAKEPSLSLFLSPEPPPLAPTTEPLPPVGNSTEDDEFDAFDDEFDFPFDAELLKQAEANIIPGFNDPLDPLFPFEKSLQQQDQNRKVVNVWDEELCCLSERGKRVMYKRQQEFRLMYGHYLSTPLWDPASSIYETVQTINTTYTNSAGKTPYLGGALTMVKDSNSSTNLNIQRSNIIPNSHLRNNPEGYPDVSDTLNTPALKKVVMNEPIIGRSAVHLDGKSEMQSEEEPGEDFAYEFDESVIANFLENRFDEDGQPVEFACFQNNGQSQSMITEKKALYYSDNLISDPTKHTLRKTDIGNYKLPETKSPGDEKKDDIIFEFDFEKEMLSDDDKEAVSIKGNDRKEPCYHSKKYGDDDEPHEPATKRQTTLNGSSTNHEVKEIVISDSEGDAASIDAVSGRIDRTANPLQIQHSKNDMVINIDSSPPRSLPLEKLPEIIEDEQSSQDSLMHAGSRTMENERDSFLLQPSKDPPCSSSPRSVLSDPESSPIIRVRKNRKRPLIEALDDSQQIPLEKQVKESESLEELSQSSLQEIQQRLKKRRKRSIREFFKQFVDDEAEKSSDGGHTTDAEGDEGSSLMNSFINDDSSILDQDSRLTMDEEELTTAGKKRINVYAQSLLQSPVSRNGKHWMNKFNADKWLNVNPDEDSILESEEYEEQLETIQDFSSNNPLPSKQYQDYFEANDDDDFM